MAPDAPAACSQPPAPFTAPAPCSPLPPYGALPNGCELNHSSLKRRRTDLGRCDGDHHEVVADLLQTATIRYATTGRPGARLLRGAALRACHGCDVRSGHATRKSADGLELMPVWRERYSSRHDPSQVAVVLIRYPFPRWPGLALEPRLMVLTRGVAMAKVRSKAEAEVHVSAGQAAVFARRVEN